MASIVIPTKDEDKIFTAMKRAKMQGPDEIIVVNEQSSSEPYKEKLSNMSGIRYFEVEGGTAKARNKGAEEAKSDKIIFLDADCYPQEGWLKAMEEALEQTDMAEGKVEYQGKRCPLNKVVENLGEEKRFLTANLGVRKEVFGRIQFDDAYDIFREDTDFGWRALKAGFKTQFVENAGVDHDAGRYDLESFVKDRLRYKTEPYFYRKFKNYDLIDREVSKKGPVYYPKELVFSLLIIVSLAVSIFQPLALIATVSLMVFLSSFYTYSKINQGKARFCPIDWLKGLVYVPLGMLAKQYAITKGVWKWR
ncbi:MAG: glycosyltransferase family 2 protein [Nanohaloarchaea archaeon]|nr:glycosyltransferase family 2 protein [Candidatus Nanohaloarchaea archaeon]